MARQFSPGGRFDFLISAACDLPPAPIRQRYLVFSQQRTGSTLLTEALVECGQAGVPIEYFNPDVGKAFWQRIGKTGAMAVPPYMDYIETHRVTANGVFGFKTHQSQLDWFIKDPQRQQNFLKRFDRVIFNYRRDKIAQSVSFLRAMAGGPWFVGRERERRPTKPEETRLDIEKILGSAVQFMRQERQQRHMMQQAGLPVLDLPYERLDEDFTGAMCDVFRFLELPESLADGMAPPLQKLRDDASLEMIERAMRALRDSDLERGGSG